MQYTNDCIKTVTVLEVTWTNCPNDVKDQVREMWRDAEFGNDNYYLSWDEEYADTYPVVAAYLASRGITECLIHFWW